MSIDELLTMVQKTNPDMTMDKLINELKANTYSTKALILTAEFNKNYNANKK